MLGHLGFSYVGLIYLLMLFIPNIIWSKNPPKGYGNTRENKILLWFERVGQVCCSCSVLIFSDFNIAPFSVWSLWLIASFLLMILYEICWIRYFTNEHTEENLPQFLWDSGAACESACHGFLVIGYLRESDLADCVCCHNWYRSYRNPHSTFKTMKYG